MNPKSSMGTVISMRQLERIETLVQRGVGKVLVGGKRMTGKSELDGYDFAQGAFFPPTVITDVPLEDDLWREEIFGPVVVLAKFKDEDGGKISLRDESDYELAIETARENAKGKPEGKINIWCTDARR